MSLACGLLVATRQTRRAKYVVPTNERERPVKSSSLQKQQLEIDSGACLTGQPLVWGGGWLKGGTCPVFSQACAASPQEVGGVSVLADIARRNLSASCCVEAQLERAHPRAADYDIRERQERIDFNPLLPPAAEYDNRERQERIDLNPLMRRCFSSSRFLFADHSLTLLHSS